MITADYCLGSNVSNWIALFFAKCSKLAKPSFAICSYLGFVVKKIRFEELEE